MNKYIIEIKNRFILLFITWFFTFFAGYSYKEVLLFLFLELEVFSISDLQIYYFIFTDAVEIFYIFIQLALFFSFQFVILHLLYHIYVFLIPSLFLKEYYFVNFVLKISLFLWFFSIFFAIYIFIPITLDFFFTNHGIKHINIFFEAKITDYLNFYISSYYIFVFYSQIFAILLLFFNSRVFVGKTRKINYLIIICFSTLFSSAEIVSQMAIFLTLIIFYEFFTFIFLFYYFAKTN